jgi:hypothetical protein
MQKYVIMHSLTYTILSITDIKIMKCFPKNTFIIYYTIETRNRLKSLIFIYIIILEKKTYSS